VLSDFEIEIFESIRTQKCEYDKLKLSVKYLSDWLCRYYRKQVVILIDEYDAPISNAYITDIYEDVMNLIKGVFSACLKGNDSLKFGVLTGVLRVSRESMFSDLNNVDIYDLTHKGYSEYFGFTGEETKELLEYFGLELTDEVKGYYDGYNFGGISIYNPWSILNYASKKELVPYWVNTSGNLLIRRCLIDIDSCGKELIEKLLLGEAVAFVYNDRLTYKDFDKTSDIDIVLNLLLISGYLTFDKKINDDGVTYNYFRIPNKEVKEELINIIKSISIDGNIEKYVEFKKNLINGEKELVEKYINEILVNMSYYDKKENFYHGYMLGLFTGFLNDYYKVRSNRESGDGRYDLLIEKKDLSVGMIIESGKNADIKVGNALPLEAIPVGTVIHCIELKPGKGAEICRSAGASAQILGREGKYVLVRLQSGETRKVLGTCMATIGVVGNEDYELVNVGKAGRTRHMGIKPTNRGSVMNPNDHPHGGGEGRAPIGRKTPVTPWGKPALGYKTRKNKKASNKLIVSRKKK